MGVWRYLRVETGRYRTFLCPYINKTNSISIMDNMDPVVGIFISLLIIGFFYYFLKYQDEKNNNDKNKKD